MPTSGVRAWRAAVPLLAALALAACGAPERSDGFEVRGARVVATTDAPFAQAADFPQRVQDTLEAALTYWGGTWDDLAGVSIELSGEASVPCGGRQGLGCWEGGTIRVTTRDPGVGVFSCVEETTLVHEVGHAVIGDASHEDPRWMEFDAVAAALAGRRGYGASGAGECVLWPSVWRHPLGSR